MEACIAHGRERAIPNVGIVVSHTIYKLLLSNVIALIEVSLRTFTQRFDVTGGVTGQYVTSPSVVYAMTTPHA